ncbi:hypothetical protein [Streptomyces humicola]|uniref:hypothetical protein n=1 Tax=Streptomyces humicola TaxID=2953240 RepID=UPI00210BB117|nr:hypothetical protein [Streptomyces humicola]
MSVLKPGSDKVVRVCQAYASLALAVMTWMPSLSGARTATRSLDDLHPFGKVASGLLMRALVAAGFADCGDGDGLAAAKAAGVASSERNVAAVATPAIACVGTLLGLPTGVLPVN